MKLYIEYRQKVWVGAQTGISFFTKNVSYDWKVCCFRKVRKNTARYFNLACCDFSGLSKVILHTSFWLNFAFKYNFIVLNNLNFYFVGIKIKIFVCESFYAFDFDVLLFQNYKFFVFARFQWFNNKGNMVGITFNLQFAETFTIITLCIGFFIVEIFYFIFFIIFATCKK